MQTRRQHNTVLARLNYGLSSRAVVAARAADVTQLALAIIGETPPTSDVREAAESVAETIFALRDIRRVRQKYLSCRAPPPDEAPNVDDANVAKGLDALTVNLCLVLEAMNEMKATLKRLDEYERKMRSRYKTLVRRLDYASIEALRRQG